MKIGIPKALLYYRYGDFWKIFFRMLGCNVLIGADTNKEMMENGCRYSVDESCLPMKVFIGQVHGLLGRCDYILVPRFASIHKNEEFCVRFFGLYDTVKNTFPQGRFLTYNTQASVFANELAEFMKIGLQLGKRPSQVIRAYAHACGAPSQQHTAVSPKNQPDGINILLAAQPYILHDAMMGEPISRMIQQLGGTPVYSDQFDGAECRRHSKQISSDLYWLINKEIIGAIAANKHAVDGIILLTAFPCGTCSLVNELVVRRIQDIPLIQIILDEQQGEAGLQTRIESFIDILAQRKMQHERQ